MDFDRQGIANHANDLASAIQLNLKRSLEGLGVVSVASLEAGLYRVHFSGKCACILAGCKALMQASPPHESSNQLYPGHPSTRGGHPSTRGGPAHEQQSRLHLDLGPRQRHTLIMDAADPAGASCPHPAGHPIDDGKLMGSPLFRNMNAADIFPPPMQDILIGNGKLTGPNSVSYSLPGRVDVGGVVNARDIIIASGSVPFVPPGGQSHQPALSLPSRAVRQLPGGATAARKPGACTADLQAAASLKPHS